MQAPSTVVQLALLLVAVMPGVTYQFMRERFRGPLIAHKDTGERVLRALTASVLLDGAYLLLFGPWLVNLYRIGEADLRKAFATNIRVSTAVALLLLFGVPALCALVSSMWDRRRRRTLYSAVPSAWDFSFSKRSSCFVRARLKGDVWVGGWFGSGSYASSYPGPQEIFLQSAWKMEPDGRLRERTANSGGILIRHEACEFIEFVEVSQAGTAP